MKNSTKKMRNEIADEVFYGIPADKERSKMTPRELAKLLSECDKGTPKYILIEHELKLRIVRVQSIPVYIGIISAIIGIILGWVLGQWQPIKSTTPHNIIAKHIQSNTKNSLGNKDQEEIQQPKQTSGPKTKNVTLNSSAEKNNKTVETIRDQMKQKTNEHQK